MSSTPRLANLNGLVEQRLAVGCLDDLGLTSGLLQNDLLTSAATTLDGNDLDVLKVVAASSHLNNQTTFSVRLDSWLKEMLATNE